MKIRKKSLHRFLLPLLLTVCLLCGCLNGSRPQETSGVLPAETSADGQAEDTSPDKSNSETYEQDAQNIQKHFDDLCQTLFEDQISKDYLSLHYSLKDPEDYGITDYSRNFGTFSLAEMQENQAEQDKLRQDLAAIDISYLTDNQKLTYRILAKSLEYEELGRGLELYYQPLAPSTGIQAQLPVLLTEFIFYDKQDVEDYLTLVSGIEDYFQQILDFEKEKARAGLSLTDGCIDQIVNECGAYLLAPEHNLMAAGFDRRIDDMADLTEEERADFKARNLTILAEDFIPAYELLLNGLKELKGTCTNEQGLYYDPKGKDYYEYLVQSSIGTTYSSMEEIQKAIEQQIDSDLLTISQILKDSPETAKELENYKFCETQPEKILELLKVEMEEDFPEIVPYHYTAKYVPEELEQTLGPAFFLVPPIDAYDSCIIYINPGTIAGSQTLFTTLAHEGIPGHLYQNVYFLSRCDSSIRKILSFLGYSEGWATYVENYSYTINNGLSPELGQILAHNASASLGIHALMDLNINYFGWNREQVSDYLKQFFDVSQPNVVDSIYQAMKNDPSNYMAYYVGYLEILKMRDLAQETLKEQFQLKEFHKFLLDIGPAPFTVIEPYFKAWLMTYHL